MRKIIIGPFIIVIIIVAIFFLINNDFQASERCGECQYLENEECLAYVCCSDSDCDDNNSKTLDRCLNPGSKQARCENEPVVATKAEYIVITRASSEFYELAKYFAEKKKAKLVVYQNNIDETTSDLRKYQPTYLALVLPPQDLTPDYLDYIDEKLREIDDDPFMDVAYGIITAFDLNEGYNYVNKLLAYSTLDKIEVYGVNAWVKHINMFKEHGIEVLDKCTFTIEGGHVWCSEENKTTVSDLVEEIKGKDVFIFNLHGEPSAIYLDEGEKIKGSTSGLIGVKNNNEEIPIKLDTSLVIARSCLTARIKGKPSSLTETFPDSDLNYEGDVDSSVVLSFLKSGALNYIGAPHLANMVFAPDTTLVPQSIIEGESIGKALKNFKNWYIYNTLISSRDREAAPKSDDYTIKFIKAQLRNWILFGDPSVVISKETQKVNDCIREYSESTSIENDYLIKDVKTKIKFRKDTGDLLTHFMLVGKVSEGGKSGSGVCMLNIPLEGKLENFSITHEKIKQRYNSYFEGANNIVINAGDELLIAIPWYVIEGNPDTEEIILEFSIRMKQF